MGKKFKKPDYTFVAVDKENDEQTPESNVLEDNCISDEAKTIGFIAAVDESIDDIDFKKEEEVFEEHHSKDIINNEEDNSIVFCGVCEGIVTGCVLLNIRKEASSDSKVVDRIGLSTEVKVFVDKSTDEWLYIETKRGKHGYCMKKYIAIKQ